MYPRNEPWGVTVNTVVVFPSNPHTLKQLTQPPALKHLARVEDAHRVQGRLDAAHQIHLDVALGSREVGAFHLADAMLGRDRAAEVDDDVLDGVREVVPPSQEREFRHAWWLRDVVVDAAVAEVGKRHRPCPGAQARNLGVGTGNQFGNQRHRHGNVVLDVATLGLLRG